MDKSQIRKQAKQILDKFANALSKVEKEHDADFYVDRDEFERKEQESRMETKVSLTSHPSFKERFLKNAPEHDGDFIIAERGKWK